MAAKSLEAQFVTFSLGDGVFAVPVEVVREILDHEDRFETHNGPDYLLGLRGLGGQGLPVIDLRLRLGMNRTVKTPHTRMLVLDVPVGKRVIALGLVADRTFEVAAFRRKLIETASNIGVRWRSGSSLVYVDPTPYFACAREALV